MPRNITEKLLLMLEEQHQDFGVIRMAGVEENEGEVISVELESSDSKLLHFVLIGLEQRQQQLVACVNDLLQRVADLERES